MIELRPMHDDDLPRVRCWLQQPHVARWWLQDETAAEQLDQYRRVLAGEDHGTHLLIAVERGRGAVGWWQWYRWADTPDEARELGTDPDELGFDYALGDPAAIGRGLGTELIAALIAEIRHHHPGAAILVEPEAANTASCRVLARNGFALIDVRPLSFEPNDHPIAIYRLAGGG